MIKKYLRTIICTKNFTEVNLFRAYFQIELNFLEIARSSHILIFFIFFSRVKYDVGYN